MKLKRRLIWSSAAFAAALLSAPFSGAQQGSSTGSQGYLAYDASRETVLTGKVLSYTANSSVPPVGAHMTIQTVYGAVDVHIGSGKLLEEHQFTLEPGDSVSVTGEVLSVGQSSTFAARIVTKGSQSISVRNTKGQLLGMPGVRMPRGVR